MDVVFRGDQSGVTRRQIVVRVRRGQWRRVYPRVYTTAGPLDLAARRRAALLYAGEPAALGHLTAARVHGLDTSEETVVDVLVPHDRRIKAQPGLRVHRTRTLSDRDLRSVDGLIVTSVERTVADCLLLWGPGPRSRALATAAIQRRHTTVGRLAAAIRRGGVTTQRPFVTALLADLAGGSRSELELRFLALCRDHGLPEPDRQRRVGAYYVDAAFGPVLVELDSRAFHFDAEDWERDLRRQNELLRTGGVLLRFTWRMVCDEPASVAEAIRAALADVGSVRYR